MGYALEYYICNVCFAMIICCIACIIAFLSHLHFVRLHWIYLIRQKEKRSKEIEHQRMVECISKEMGFPCHANLIIQKYVDILLCTDFHLTHIHDTHVWLVLRASYRNSKQNFDQRVTSSAFWVSRIDRASTWYFMIFTRICCFRRILIGTENR